MMPFLRTRWGAATVALYASLALFVSWVLQQPDSESRQVRAASLALGTAAILLFVTAALRLARAASGRLRIAWLLLVAGELTLEAADIVYTALGYPPLSFADLLYLCFFPVMLAGVLMLPYAPISREDRLVLALDRLLVLLAGATFIWYLLAPWLQRWSTLTSEARLNLLYPALELVLFAAALTLIQRDVHGVHRVTLTILALAFAAGCASSLVDLFAILTRVDELSVSWLAVAGSSYVLMATAPAWQIATGGRPEEQTFSTARRMMRTALPYLAAAGSALVLALAVSRGGSPVQTSGILAGTTLTMLALLCRQHVVLRHNVRLYEDLDAAHLQLERQNESLVDHMQRLVAAKEELQQLNEELERVARTDTLTGLANRHQLMTRFEEEWGRASRHRRPLSLLLLDLDHFKRVNDEMGHPTGDRVLKAVGWAVQAAVRPVDLAARYGGEELAVLLPETGLDGASELARRLCTALREIAHPDDRGNPFTVTVSAGAAAREATDRTLADLVARADAALYHSKETGRDGVSVATGRDLRRLPEHD
jgi:diguanylate cyclase (GGDEF)-like protein